jgi:hypothetical protein
VGTRHHVPRGLLQVRADHDRHARSPDCRPLEHLKHPAQHGRFAERKVLQLLRQARMHVIDVRNAQCGGNYHANRRAFLVRMDRIVAAAACAIEGRQCKREIQKDLGCRGADLHTRDERRSCRSEDAKSWQDHVLAEGVRDEVNSVAEIEKCADTVILAEWSTPRLEKRLGGDHQNVHDDMAIVGNGC